MSDEEDVIIEKETKQIEEPKRGMAFDTVDDIVTYYKPYGKQMGFAIWQRTCSKAKGIVSYVTITCHRAGKSHQTTKKLLKPQLVTKLDCPARICAKLCEDSKWRLTTIIIEHNHHCSPQKSRRFRSNQILKPHVKRQLDLNERAGIRINKTFNSLVVEAGGYDNMPFIERDVRNHIAKVRRLMLGEGDMVALQEYLKKAQLIDKEFFYSIKLDKKSRIQNIFWTDSRSRAAYEEFGDVITFDTTYPTNKYDMHFAPFVGVNHHGQSTLFGCGLIANENTDSFAWLFDSWLTCMSGKAPNAIITYQDNAMRNAIEMVFPNVCHRLCLWHILKKVPVKLRRYEKYNFIKFSLLNVVYDSLYIDEFKVAWKEMCVTYELESNKWLIRLYDERQRWVPCFVKDDFWAGMSTTQRSESMNSFFDDYVNANTSLKQFVDEYDNALRSKVKKEN